MTANFSYLLPAQRYKELALITVRKYLSPVSARKPPRILLVFGLLEPFANRSLGRKCKKRSSRVNHPPTKKALKRVKFVEEPIVHRIPPLPKKPQGKVRMPEDEYPLRRDNVTIEGETITSPAIERRKNMRMKQLAKKLELLQRRQEEFFNAYSEKLNAIIDELTALNH